MIRKLELRQVKEFSQAHTVNMPHFSLYVYNFLYICCKSFLCVFTYNVLNAWDLILTIPGWDIPYF